MSAVLGVENWGSLILAAILICLAVAAYRFWSRRRPGADSAEAPMMAGGRLAVLESSTIDETRRLVLVRCDDVEHLIVVGGGADLVVENDVRKSRAAKTALKSGVAEPARRLPASPQLPAVPQLTAAPQPAQSPAQPAGFSGPNPTGVHPVAPQPAGAPPQMLPSEARPTVVGHPDQPSEERRPKLRPADVADRAARPALTAVPAPGRNGHAAPTPAVRPGPGPDEKARVPVIGVQRPAEPPKLQPRAVAEVPRAVAPVPTATAPEPEKPRTRVVDRIFGRREPAVPAPPQELPPATPQRAAANGTDETAAEVRRSRADFRPADDRVGISGSTGNTSGGRGQDFRHASANPDLDMRDADALEGDIVRALQSGEDGSPFPRPEQPHAERPRPEQPRQEQPRQEPPRQEQRPAAQASEVRPAEAKTAAAKPAANPATTLGDLAERLEEALAREVKAANQNRNQVDPDLDAFDFELDAPGRAVAAEPQQEPVAERPQPQPQRAPQVAVQSAPPPAATAPAVIVPASEPEQREAWVHEERQQEEAPVINLHERRREAPDPLEDEMARLLGELTGDTNRR